MIKAQILIEMTDGALYTYANNFLKEKVGTDDENNKKFAGEPGKYYMYTGFSGDTYEDQDQPGMVKADYEFLISASTASGYLKFPESDTGAATSGSLIEELILPSDKEIGTSTAVSRVKLQTKFVKDIKLVETEVVYPFGRANENKLAVAPKTEELYTIPREIQKTYKRYVPMPVIKDGIVTNYDDFEEIYYRPAKIKNSPWVELEDEIIPVASCELYGVINELASGIVYYKVS